MQLFKKRKTKHSSFYFLTLSKYLFDAGQWLLLFDSIKISIWRWTVAFTFWLYQNINLMLDSGFYFLTLSKYQFDAGQWLLLFDSIRISIWRWTVAFTFWHYVMKTISIWWYINLTLKNKECNAIFQIKLWKSPVRLRLPSKHVKAINQADGELVSANPAVSLPSPQLIGMVTHVDNVILW